MIVIPGYPGRNSYAGLCSHRVGTYPGTLVVLVLVVVRVPRVQVVISSAGWDGIPRPVIRRLGEIQSLHGRRAGYRNAWLGPEVLGLGLGMLRTPAQVTVPGGSREPGRPQAAS
eukprot:2832746-Rhodomonas_salina.2